MAAPKKGTPSVLGGRPAPAPVQAPVKITTPVQTGGVMQGGSYYPQSTQTSFEKQAGVDAPQYYSSLDSSGNLKTPFQVDPTKSAAFQQMSGIASSSALSPWAQMQMDSNTNATSQQRDQLNAQTQGSNDSAMQNLMVAGGGANSGARAFLAAQGAKQGIQGNQNIGFQSQQNALGIQQADAQNKQQLLGQVANTETGAQAANSASGLQDMSNANQFAANRYSQQMQAWGAQQSADAQRAAAGGGKK